MLSCENFKDVVNITILEEYFLIWYIIILFEYLELTHYLKINLRKCKNSKSKILKSVLFGDCDLKLIDHPVAISNLTISTSPLAICDLASLQVH